MASIEDVLSKIEDDNSNEKRGYKKLIGIVERDTKLDHFRLYFSPKRRIYAIINQDDVVGELKKLQENDSCRLGFIDENVYAVPISLDSKLDLIFTGVTLPISVPKIGGEKRQQDHCNCFHMPVGGEGFYFCSCSSGDHLIVFMDGTIEEM